MQAHRFRDLVEDSPGQQSPAPTVQSNAFMACPILMAQAQCGGLAFWQIAVYQLAFEKAQAAQRPAQSLRNLLPSLN
jgi:hypothetical protein